MYKTSINDATLKQQCKSHPLIENRRKNTAPIPLEGLSNRLGSKTNESGMITLPSGFRLLYQIHSSQHDERIEIELGSKQ